MGVRVRSIAPTSEPRLDRSAAVSNSSRVATAVGSSSIASPGTSRWIRVRCASDSPCVSARYASAAPAACRPAVIVPTPKASSAVGPKRATSRSRAGRGANHPGSPGRHRHAERFALAAPLPVGVARHQELGGPPEQRRLEQGGARAVLLPHPEVPGGDVDEGRAEGARRAMEREEEVVRGPVQELRVGDGARRDDAHDLAPHQLLALGGRLHLLAHGDLLARADEARDVAVGGVVRDPRHRDRPLALLARRERELQQAGRGVRVLEEQLVEISEAEQQQIVRVALLELPVLQHHRSQLGRGLRHESSAADRRS